MIRIFNRYLSAWNTLYFILENILMMLFLIWGSFLHGGWAELFIVLVVVQICLHYNDLYPSSAQFSMKKFWQRHVQAILWAAGILSVLYFLFQPQWSVQEGLWVRVLVFPLILIGLRVAYQTFAAKEGNLILVVGSDDTVAQIKAAVSERTDLGYSLIHLPWKVSSPDCLEESIRRLTEIIAQYPIAKVVIAVRDRRQQFPLESLIHLRVQGVEIVEAVAFYEQISGKVAVTSLKPSHLIFGEGFRRGQWGRFLKRGFDIVLALGGLVLVAPIVFLVMLAIRLDSKGPIFYLQERVGEKGRPFTLIKFRSMREDAEIKSGPVWASLDDPRITRVGRILRMLRLDEIPQIINVLKGEMSFVGPRPEREVFVRQLCKKIPYYDLRFTVKPGITGWAQVKYRYGASEDDALQKIQYDLYYVKYFSFLFDFTIILETLRVVLSGKGAR